MTLPGLLGANLWIVLVAVPLTVGRGFAHGAPAGAIAAVVLLALLAPATLLLGIARRAGALLLFAFPALTALPGALLGGGELQTQLVPAPPYLISALSLIGYLLVTAHALEKASRAAEAPPDRVRSLAGEPEPLRWRRRKRVFRGLAICAAIFPLALIWDIGLRSRTTLALTISFGERAPAAQALLLAAAGCLSLVVFRGYLLAPLHSHLQQDREVLEGLGRVREQARRGRPRPAFYLFVALALAAMTAVVWQRAHS